MTDDSIRTYAKNLGITFEILHDPTHAIEKRVSDDGLSRDVRDRTRGHDSQEVDRPRRLELAGQSRAHRATARTARRRDARAVDRRSLSEPRCLASRRPPRASSSLQRRVVAAFTQQVPLKATAVFLAVVLWFMVNAKEPQIELVPVRFIPTLDSSLVLRDPLPQIQAIVAGSPKELIKLNSSLPAIRRQITADAPDTLVIDLRPAT